MAQEVKHHLGKKTQRHFTTKYFRPFWAYADIAQSVVHRLGKAEVTGSSPVISSIIKMSLYPSKILHKCNGDAKGLALLQGI